MKHSRLGDEQFKVNVVLVTLVFVTVMAALGGAAWLTKSAKSMPPAKPGSLVAPASTNAPPQSK